MYISACQSSPFYYGNSVIVELVFQIFIDVWMKEPRLSADLQVNNFLSSMLPQLPFHGGSVETSCITYQEKCISCRRKKILVQYTKIVQHSMQRTCKNRVYHCVLE